jgi:ATP-dependent RNA helicase DDX27
MDLCIETSRQLYEGNSVVTKSKDAVAGIKRSKYAGLSRKVRRRKLALEEDTGTAGAVNASIRQAKKLSRPSKIGESDNRASTSTSRASKTKQQRQGRKLVGFQRDLGDRKTA